MQIRRNPCEHLIDVVVVGVGTEPGRPSIIIARTTKGKGVSFMEGVARWHGTPPNDEEYARAMAELG